MPKVVKAVPNVLGQEALKSPTTAYSTSKESVSLIGPLSGMEHSKQLLNKSRQSNIFQARRSQTTTQKQEDRKDQQQN